MNINLLIEAIVRQTTVLIAQLATSAGGRASLGQTADQVFSSLVRELKDQGLGNKLIADMFGLSLRTYHNRMRRLSESSTDRGESLWSAVLGFVRERETVGRAEVLRRFVRDDERMVKSLLGDLVSSGLVFAKGTGDNTVYRASAVEDLALTEDAHQEQALINLVWITVARHGPLSRSRLLQMVALDESQLDVALTPLTGDGRVTVHQRGSELSYRSEQCIIGYEQPAGWEASVFDHYQAMVIALCSKLRTGRTAARQDETVGGSTYGFDVWPGHPHSDQVFGFLAGVREQATQLRTAVDAYNETAVRPTKGTSHVIAYVGQVVIDGEEPSREV